MRFIKASLKAIFPAAMFSAFRRWLAPWRLRKSWLNRRTTKKDDHLSIYWNAHDQPNRKQLISLLIKEISQLNTVEEADISILEYGSHVGLNLNLIKKALNDSLISKMYAIEPNYEAVQFLKNKMPDVITFHGEDKNFCKTLNFPPDGKYLSFVNSVFYSMTPRRVEKVLTKLCKFSSTIVIGESIENIEGEFSRLRENPECFEHPYEKLLNKNGFKIFYLSAAVDPKPQLNGFIVARKI